MGKPVTEADDFMTRFERFKEKALTDLLATGVHINNDGPVPFAVKIVTDTDGRARLVTEYPDR